MHREISHAGNNLQPESRLFLYLLTAVVAGLIGVDVWLWITAGADDVTFWGFRFSFALVPAILGGARILYGSLDSLFEGRIGADLAVAVACVAAILARRPEVAEEVVFVGLLGECLEHITFERSQRGHPLDRRHLPAPLLAAPRRSGGARPRRRPARRRSDRRQARRPCAGRRHRRRGPVVAGRAARSTGEGLPAEKGPGDEVLAGSLNQHGALTIEARRVAEHTVVGRVIELTARRPQGQGADRAHRRPPGPLVPAGGAGAGRGDVPRRPDRRQLVGPRRQRRPAAVLRCNANERRRRERAAGAGRAGSGLSVRPDPGDASGGHRGARPSCRHRRPAQGRLGPGTTRVVSTPSPSTRPAR